ncbi:hypothetical protein OROGR_007145 [Orobanche gracilis]
MQTRCPLLNEGNTQRSFSQLNTVMLLQICDFNGVPFPKTGNIFGPANAYLLSSRRNFTTPFRCVSELACHSISVHDIAGVLHNKVLVAAGLSAAIGQLSKPFTSNLLYGKKFDIKAVLQAGGFPSTHSSVVVATATSLVLERGFSDPVFGLSVVYAALVMYDAQGVRREVGTHAKELNKVLLRTASYSTSFGNVIRTDSSCRGSSSSSVEIMDPVFSEDQKSFQKNPINSSMVLKSDDMQTISTYTRSSHNVEPNCSPLKESIGHTEIEVVAGALLGFLVSLAICTYV